MPPSSSSPRGCEAIGPNGLTFTRIAIGYLTLAGFPAARRPILRADWPATALLGVLWMAFPLSMFPYAEQRVSSALTGMLNGANPLFVAAVAAFLARRAPSRGVAVGLAVGLIGTVLIALPSLNQGSNSMTGVLLCLAGVTSYGFALNLARPLQMRNGALGVIWRALGVALLLTAPLGIPELLRAHWTPTPLLSLLALGALGTGDRSGAACLRRRTRRRDAGLGHHLPHPRVALALGVAVRGESVATLSIVGGVVCLAGAWLVRRAQLGARPE